MKYLILVIEFCFVLSVYALFEEDPVLKNPDTYRNVTELIVSEGYPCQEHTVLTIDGYFLSIQRIPYGKNGSMTDKKKGVVLFIHGEVGDSDAWFLNEPDRSLGYLLPDHGYDVWLLNNRGSDYSQKNVYYDTRDPEFWEFSFDEMAEIDVPATIDYILNMTGEQNLSTIGYSRGNTVAYIMLSELPEYNEKVKIHISLAPVAFVGHMTSSLTLLIPFAEELGAAVRLFFQGELFPWTKHFKRERAVWCAASREICSKLIFSGVGTDYEHLNYARFPLYIAQYFSTTSEYCLLHYGQLYRSKQFRKYDFGPVQNLLYYGQLEPPDYPLHQITTTQAFFSSKSDIIADTIDVNILRSKLNNCEVIDTILEDYNHFDFIWANNSLKAIYVKILKLLETY